MDEEELRTVIRATLTEHGRGYGVDGYTYDFEVDALATALARLVRVEDAARRLVTAWPNDDHEFDVAMSDLEECFRVA